MLSGGMYEQHSSSDDKSLATFTEDKLVISKEKIKERLQQTTQLLKISYYRTFLLISRRLSMTPLEELLKVFSENIQKKCSDVKSTDDIFLYDSPLIKEWRWYNLTLLTTIVKEFGDDVCRRSLASYKDNLRQYILSRILKDNNEMVGKTMHIVVDREWNWQEAGGESSAREYIAALLNTLQDNIVFVSENSMDA